MALVGFLFMPVVLFAALIALAIVTVKKNRKPVTHQH